MFKGIIKATGEIADFNTCKVKGETMLQRNGTISFFKPEEVESINLRQLKERLTVFAKKAGKEVSSDKDIQTLAEGCVWIGAIWMTKALGIKGFKEKED